MLKDKYLKFFSDLLCVLCSWHSACSGRVWSLAFVSGHWHWVLLFAVKLFAQEFKTIKRRTQLSGAVALCKIYTSVYLHTFFNKKIHTNLLYSEDFNGPRTKPTKPLTLFAKKKKGRKNLNSKVNKSRQRSRAGPIQAGTGQRNLGQHLGKMARGDGFGETGAKEPCVPSQGPCHRSY